MSDIRKDALEYHRLGGKPGKISIQPTKPLDSQRDLALAYTPGVAEPVLEIAKHPEKAFDYTSRGNLVAVITNGTAILGLGNRGALASKPVMEGKAVLFKKFADIDVFDIEINSEDPDEIIQVVRAISPTFGGINLEDIKAPECFYIEDTLKKMLDIPVFHDDQHGTAIITAAGLQNALEIVKKDIHEIKLVVSGAGAAGLSCVRMAIMLGVPSENITLSDIHGVVYKGRLEGMNPYLEPFAQETSARTLDEIIEDADVFYGLSAGGVLKPEMVKKMARDPIIFAMANPTPEIDYDLAKKTRPDAIVTTGRSDFPNQVNNVLGFPFIFRGALDVLASAINDEMKLAAANALAALAKEDIPDSVLSAYGLETLKFGREYIIPKPLDPRVLLWEAPAVAEAAIKSGVARRKIDLQAYREQLALRQGKGQQVRQYILNQAKAVKKKVRIVFAEGEEDKIIRAAEQVYAEGIGHPILLGRPDLIAQRAEELGVACHAQMLDHYDCECLEDYIKAYYELRRRNGVTMGKARKHLRDPNVFGAMMVKCADADAFVSGLTYEYPEVIRPTLQIHHTSPATHIAASVYLMIVEDKVYFFTDATVNIESTASDIAEIAILAADFATRLDVTPRIALLSFSNFGSTPHPNSRKMQQAVGIIRHLRPDLMVDGEMQADTALSEEIIDRRYPFSQVRDANVLVFPSLEAANIAYKLVDKLGHAQKIGPILLGVGAPVHVLQTGDEVRDIVNIAAVAAMDAGDRK